MLRAETQKEHGPLLSPSEVRSRRGLVCAIEHGLSLAVPPAARVIDRAASMCQVGAGHRTRAPAGVIERGQVDAVGSAGHPTGGSRPLDADGRSTGVQMSSSAAAWFSAGMFECLTDLIGRSALLPGHRMDE